MIVPTPRSRVSLLVVGKAPGFLSLVTQAFHAIFPDEKIQAVDRFVDAITTAPLAPVELLVLLDPTESEVAEAAATKDSAHLPRWAVVTFTSAAAGNAPGMLALADCGVRTLGPVLRWAAIAQELKRENARWRGDFLSVGTRVVHDLRSPLGGILTTAEVLNEVLQDEAPQHAPLTEPLMDSTEGLAKIIGQLGTLAKAIAGTNPKVRVNMAGPFWAAFQQVEREALKIGATLRQAATWPDVEGDASWLEAMWHALLLNALQHAGPAPRIEAGWSRLPGENRFWLADSGKVPPERRATLFPSFHLLHRPSAPRGLGLAIVRRLAELQGGHCGYEADAGDRSRFFFTLPILDATRASEPAVIPS